MHPRPKRILIVDDDDDLVESIELAFREYGYDVVAASDGTSGLMRAERDAPDLILLDVVMPLRSGFSVLERLRPGRPSGPPVIVMTAGSEGPRRDFALSHGASAFFAKPFDIDDLLATVRRLLQ